MRWGNRGLAVATLAAEWVERSGCLHDRQKLAREAESRWNASTCAFRSFPCHASSGLRSWPMRPGAAISDHRVVSGHEQPR